MSVTIVDLYRQLFGKGSLKDGDVIGMAEHGRAGGDSTGQPYKFTREVDEPTLVDEVDADTTYVGKTKQGSTGDTSSAIWQIRKISVSGTVTTIAYADGNDSYDNIWANRTSLSYS